jgi:hypothetical protein
MAVTKKSFFKIIPIASGGPAVAVEEKIPVWAAIIILQKGRNHAIVITVHVIFRCPNACEL